MRITKKVMLSYIIPIGVAVLAVGIAYIAYEDNNDRAIRNFHETISQADRVVIRKGGFDCCRTVDHQEIVIEITDTAEIETFNDIFDFAGIGGSCLCCGYPGIDWYVGKKRIALAGVQHCLWLRWKGFGKRDASFTEESSVKLAKWMLEHKVPDPNSEFSDTLKAAGISFSTD